MKIVIAPDSFKGSLTAAQVCEAIASGVLKAAPKAEIVSIPMADGGEGTIQSLIDGLGGKIISCTVEGPLGRYVEAGFGLTSNGVAVVEMAQASGLSLIKESERDPVITSTYGTGELIKNALDWGAREFIIGIGGSSTNDGGAGMAQALGYSFLDEAGKELPRGGGALLRLAKIDASGADTRLLESRFTVACDVDNPLLGKCGASAVYGPQKGATPEKVALLENALVKLAERMRECLGKNVESVSGAGAAGGLGAGCLAFLNAELKKGVQIVIDATGIAEKLAGAAVVITGEGCTDSQTLCGKTVFGVITLAKSIGVPAIVISGSLAPAAVELLNHGAIRLYALMESGITLDEAMNDGPALLEKQSMNAMNDYLNR